MVKKADSCSSPTDLKEEKKGGTLLGGHDKTIRAWKKKSAAFKDDFKL